jgi:hypothetical protein
VKMIPLIESIQSHGNSLTPFTNEVILLCLKENKTELIQAILTENRQEICKVKYLTSLFFGMREMIDLSGLLKHEVELVLGMCLTVNPSEVRIDELLSLIDVFTKNLANKSEGFDSLSQIVKNFIPKHDYNELQRLCTSLWKGINNLKS